MAVTANVTEGIRVGSEAYLSAANDYDGDNGQLIDDAIADGASGVAVGILPFTAAKLVAIYLLSDQDITLSFALSAGGPLSVALEAGIPWAWNNSYPATLAIPFSANVTGVTGSNASGAAATLKGRVVTTA